YMLSYDNGKGATRVVPGAAAAGVHAWSIGKSPSLSPIRKPADSSEEHTYLRNATTLSDVRTLDLAKLYRCDEACVLHFVVCGLYWYLKKYKILDAFPNAW